MRIVIIPTENGPAGKLADAELHFDQEALLAGLKLVGFAVWQSNWGTGLNVTVPSRDYQVNGERRRFDLLRITADQAALTELRRAVQDAYQDYCEHGPLEEEATEAVARQVWKTAQAAPARRQAAPPARPTPRPSHIPGTPGRRQAVRRAATGTDDDMPF